MKVLFVEDEPLALELIGQSLVSSGYEVKSFHCPCEALEWFKKNQHEVDVLVTDQSMPKLTGIELIVETRKLKPGLPTVLVTGAGAFEHELLKHKEIVILEKPYKKKELFEAIIYVMGEKS